MMNGSNACEGLPIGDSNSFALPVRPRMSCLIVTSYGKFLGRGRRLQVSSTGRDGRCILRFPLTSVSTPMLVSGVFCSFSGTALAPTDARTLSGLMTLLGRGSRMAVRLDTRYSCGNGYRCGGQLSRHHTRAMISCLVTRNVRGSHLAPIKCNGRHPGAVHEGLARGCP